MAGCIVYIQSWGLGHRIYICPHATYYLTRNDVNKLKASRIFAGILSLKLRSKNILEEYYGILGISFTGYAR